MATIIPRWEWRTFGSEFGGAEERIASLGETGVQESDELYLLSGGGDNVKVRDDLMDIKVLVETDPQGLQQWRPVMKAAFPLPASDVVRVFEALCLPVPPLERDLYPLERFVSELAEPTGALRAVPVHKRRRRYLVGGCTAEVTDVVADGRTTRTIAVESEDGAAVLAAVRSVGLGDYVNTSYPRGLSALVADAAPHYAVIDVGTNSVKFHIGERRPDGTWRTIADRAEITRLGEGLEEHGSISSEAMERTAAAIGGMVEEARREDCLAIGAVGTAGLRIAGNRDDVVAAIDSRTGVVVDVIPSEEEARLAYLAVQASIPLAGGSLVVFDTGGGSSQFTFGHGPTIDERFSVEVGAVKYTERFGLAGEVDRDTLAEALAAISADLSDLDGRELPDTLVGMGGAITNITAVKHGLVAYDPEVVQGTVLDLDEIDRQIERYRSRDAAERRSIPGLQPKRADVILAGACIVRTVMAKLGAGSLIVSDRGLRHGLLVERFGRPAMEEERVP